MMRDLSRFSRSIIALAALIGATLPVAADAAPIAGPRVYCMIAFNDEIPDRCDPATFRHEPQYIGKLAPSIEVYPSQAGVLYVEGNADPGAKVTVTVTDGDKSMTEVVTALAAPDPGTGERRGDFRVAFDPVNDPNETASIAELGRHTADPGDDPLTVSPPGSGLTRLTVIATAEMGGIEGTPLEVFVDKYAASAGDTQAPVLKGLKFPPAHWCRYSSRGAQMPGVNQHLGGDDDGRCGTLSMDGVGAIPDATWVFCVKETSELPDLVRNGLVDLQSMFPGGPYCDYNCMSNPFRGNYCRTNAARTVPHGEAPVIGLADDSRNDGTGSEIASVVIEVFQGSTLLDRWDDRFARATSTTARWGFVLKINDFEPNWPGGVPYVVKVTATDAWGRVSSAQSAPITVYPY
ncbi:MAG: hypothetical protein ACLGH3_03840 [Actinomycetota bacterium]